MKQARRTFLKQATTAAGILAVPPVFRASTALAEGTKADKDGWRPLFDGKTLAGWKPQPRDIKYPSLGRWDVVDGVLVGGQSTPKLGSYLTSEETFADFEMEFDSYPDWPADTGVYVRTNAQGNIGFQFCIDNRPHGALVGYYGNAIGGFHACDYCFTGELDANGKLVRLIVEKPSEPLDDTHHVPLDYCIPSDDFLKLWNLNGWNHYRIRSVGAVPHLTTWINGQKVAELDTAKMSITGWDSTAIDGLVGRAGHISLEVHSNGVKDWLGDDRWAPGNVCRWRNMRIKTL